MKKLALLSILLTSLPIIAHANHYDGPYLGVGVGLTQMSSKASKGSTLTIPSGPLNIAFSGQVNDHASSAQGEFHVGYNKLITPSTYLALEARLNLYSLNNTHSLRSLAIANGSVASDFSLKSVLKQSSPSASLVLKPGVLISPKSSIYAVLGVARSTFKFSTRNIFVQMGNTLPTSGNTSSVEYGAVIGAGMHSYISKNVGIGLEYNYTHYGKIKTPDITSTVDNNTTFITRQLKTQNSSVLVRLSYHL